MGWKVADMHGNTAYLVGTVHAATEDLYPLPDAIEEAFSRAQVLVLEVDMRILDQRAMNQLVQRLGLLPNRESLRALLPSETWSAVMAWAHRVSVSPSQINRMRPWLAATTLTNAGLQQMGVRRDLGMEEWLLRGARDRGLEVVGLETVEEQVSMLADVPLEVQVEFLEGSIMDESEFIEAVNDLLGAWRSGDLARMTAILREMEEGQPLVYERMMRDRNHRWMAPVESMIGSGRVHYIAVGALHLVGDDGLPALLEARGYSLERLD